MPVLDNAKKALRSSQRKAAFNRGVKSRVKTMVDKMHHQPSAKNLATVHSSIDRASKRNIFHKNKAARLKSQMQKLLPATK